MSIAVLIATYNSAEFLLEGLESISAQQRRPEEVVVVDDGSGDDTLAIVEGWAARQAVSGEDLAKNLRMNPTFPGVRPEGRTTGLRHASSDFVACLDHDDLMLPDHLRLTERALVAHPQLELVFGDAIEFSPDGSERSLFAGKAIEKVAYTSSKECDPLRILSKPMLDSMVTGSYVPTAANLWRRETALRIGGFERRAGACDDVLFFVSLSRCGPVGYYPQAIARRRIHLDNLSHTRYSMERCRDHIASSRLMLAGSASLRLSPDEQSLIRSHLVGLVHEFLYHASQARHCGLLL